MQAAGGDVLEANRAAERLLGLSVAQLREAAREPRAFGLRVMHEDGSAFPPCDYPSVRTLATGLPQTNETMMVRTPSGELR